nr:RDD family protein [uncultured Faecalimonas sp.]
MQNNYNRSGEPAVYAGFFVRMAAHLIDMLLVGILLLFARIPFALFSMVFPTDFLEKGVLFSYTIKDIYLYLGGVLYYILLTYYTGTTPGKRLMNLRVVQEDGQKLTLFNVIYRETIGRFLCSFFWGIGYIMAGIDGQKRGLHDMICGTRVIYEKRVKVTVVNNGAPQRPYGMPYQSMQKPDAFQRGEGAREKGEIHTLPTPYFQAEGRSVRAESEHGQCVEKADREVCRQMQGDKIDEKIEKRQEIKETEDEKRRL